jgi:hypothetical protein
LTQSTDRKEVAPILACINRYALEISATPIGHHLNANSSLSSSEFGLKVILLSLVAFLAKLEGFLDELKSAGNHTKT